MVEPALCADGRFALARKRTNLTYLCLCTATERKVFFTELRALLKTPAALIVGRDSNCVLNARDRVRGSTAPIADAGANALRDAVRDFDLVGITEMLDSFSRRFHGWQGASQARLDRVYISSELSDGIQSYDAKIVPFSDHGFVATVLRSGGPGPRRARRDTTWKMNAGILEEEGVEGGAANSMVAKLSPWQPRYISVFIRAQVCNTVTYPAVFYKAQAVCCPGVTAKKIHRSWAGWATFVWRSSWERTRRDNLFLHQESGGLGLLNIVIKLNVQEAVPSIPIRARGEMLERELRSSTELTLQNL
ncbi:hypothetical protein HPB47_008611 [Ixodes persulcatus]|uniref:Uncharacterized protein n=1 Tax=Ixodes persulcatus TaxID=34615 RepID=A0AC60P4D4_IXOPE|nr:hypothetical protein HPB47_008611 [Ixodes persulcatus]